jgi:hypothetical protein
MPKGMRTVAIRATNEWVAWLEKLAKHYRTTTTGVIDRALTEWAASQGYAEPPPERIPWAIFRKLFSETFRLKRAQAFKEITYGRGWDLPGGQDQGPVAWHGVLEHEEQQNYIGRSAFSERRGTRQWSSRINSHPSIKSCGRLRPTGKHERAHFPENASWKMSIGKI